MSDEDAAWDEKLSKETNLSEEAASRRAWRQAIVSVLNAMYEAPQVLKQKDAESCFKKVGGQLLEQNLKRLSS